MDQSQEPVLTPVLPSANEVTPALSVRQKLKGWALDYAYVIAWLARGAVAKSTPDDLLSPPPPGPRAPILLVPGVYENWRFLQPVAAHLYSAGHPVHVLDKLGWNTGGIPEMAVIVRDYLERLDLDNVTVVAHSKGGLIAKQALADPATSRRVRHLIAVNTPFSGSAYASLFLLPSVKMFAPTGPVIRQLSQQTQVNAKISSLYSVFDPHIPETSHLDGAENVVLPTIGHFRPLADPRTLHVVDDILTRTTNGVSSTEPT